ncbi:MAG: transporter substrate-binding domain-containing protein [Bacteroidales bacterium]|nr:transporter substrate-binding domain-containing protein [Bacteroidales bacterium]
MALFFFGIRESVGHVKNSGDLVENTSDRISILLHCHSSDYFLYKGRPIGFQYELLHQMCDSLGLKPRFTLSTDAAEVKEGMVTGAYDIIAVDLDDEMADTTAVDLSVPHSTSFPVLICRDGDAADYPKLLYVPAHFPAYIQLSTLGDSTEWQVIRSSDMDVEEFFGLLQDKKIHYLVSDYNTVLALLPFYPDLTIAARIGPEYQRRWVLNPANTTLNARINQWLTDFKQTGGYKELCNKYLKPHTKYLTKGSQEKRSKRISPYDAVIKRLSKARGLDWRFVCSIIYQESRFTTTSIGVGGSFGIMQMMPGTGEHFGVDANSSVESQLYAGISLISSINRQFRDIEDENERMFFVAASYNAGSGHIHDARSLCRKYGGNADVWMDVEPYLALKSDKKFYTDPVVRNGYFPGKHTIRYTHSVMDRYHGYRVSLPEK